MQRENSTHSIVARSKHNIRLIAKKGNLAPFNTDDNSFDNVLLNETDVKINRARGVIYEKSEKWNKLNKNQILVEI